MKLKKSIYKILPSDIICQDSCVLERFLGNPFPGKMRIFLSWLLSEKKVKLHGAIIIFITIFFFSIPKDYTKPFYIRVFDPDCGGENDEIQGEFNTKTKFSVYGGKGVDPEMRMKNQEDSIKGEILKQGNLLASKIFGIEDKYDNKYYTFGPFNPSEGDFNTRWNSNIFKIICEGISGDDGNLYRYFLSSDANTNIPIEGANAFTYAYHFRMWNDFKSVAHIYPFIDTGIVSISRRILTGIMTGIFLLFQGISRELKANFK